MQIVTIRSFEEFDALKSDWDSIHAADSNATIRVSWSWLRAWFEATPHSWFVLAVRPDEKSKYVCFLPLAMALDELLTGGAPVADYSGFVCCPECESQALQALAKHLTKRPVWREFRWINGMDSRIDEFLGYFPLKKFHREQLFLGRCPCLQLPGTWDAYLSDSIGKTTSRDLRRSLRKIDESPEFHVTIAEEGTLERHVDALLDGWKSRWKLPEFYSHGFKNIMHRTHSEGKLWLSVLWDGEKPIGCLAGFIEHEKKVFTALLTISDRSYSQLRPGKTIYAYGIKYAIENGCSIFDFTQGDEEYKYSLGGVDRFSPSIMLTRKTCWTRMKDMRDRMESLPVIGPLARLTHFHKLKERLFKADTQPRSTDGESS